MNTKLERCSCCGEYTDNGTRGAGVIACEGCTTEAVEQGGQS